MPTRTLFLDIETYPLTAHVWGLWNQNVGINQILDSGNTICYSAKWLGDKKVHFQSEYHDGEWHMLNGVHALLDEADAVVTWNGDKFDLPTLNKEFLKHDFLPPSPYKKIDLLKTSRRVFRFPSNKLDYVARALGLGTKVKHKGHDLWIECGQGDEKAWNTMRRYNKQDVVLLEKIYKKFLPFVPKLPNQAAYTQSGDVSCPACGSHHVQRRGVSVTSTLTYQRYQCQDCGTWSRSRLSEKTVNKPKLVKE